MTLFQNTLMWISCVRVSFGENSNYHAQKTLIAVRERAFLGVLENTVLTGYLNKGISNGTNGSDDRQGVGF